MTLSYENGPDHFGHSRGWKRRHALFSTSVVALTIAAGWSHTASAQTPAPQTAQSIEEITVTATRVVRDGYEAPTPTTVVGVEQLEQQAAPSVIEYLNTVPAFSGNYTPASSTRNSGGAPGTASVNLRNLGTNRTLVLINGQRSVGATPAGAVDVNTIPDQLITRVDVVTGGASSAYGSDAVAGVVNFVLDTKFTGVKGQVSGGVTTYGDNRNFQVAVTAGAPFANDRGHFEVSGGITHNDGILLANRDWNQQGWLIITNPTYTATNGQPSQLLVNHAAPAQATKGGIITAGPLKGIAFGPGGTPYNFNYGSIVAGGIMQGGDWQSNYGNVDGGATLEPELTRQNLFARASYEVADNLEVYVQSNWYHTSSLTYAYGNWFFGGITVSASNPFLPASVATAAASAGVTTLNLGTLNLDMGRNALENGRYTLRNVVGLDGKAEAFDTNWTWSAYYQAGLTRSADRVVGTRNTNFYNLAIDAVRSPTTGAIVCRSTLTNPNNGCVPYNPFGIGVNSQAALNYVLGTAMRDQRFKQDVFAANVSGDPFSTWAGSVSVATGIEHRRESAYGFVSAQDLLNPFFAGNYRPTIGTYSVTEGFIETVVPLARDTAWAKSLDFNGAVRGTSYSTAGYVTTWKAGLTYAVIDDITLRATRSRDIRAPNLNDLFNLGSTTTNSVTDDATRASVQYLGTTKGNPLLQPEKADTTGVGVVLQPKFFEGFSASVDYWNIDLRGAITTVTAQQTVDLCYQGNQPFCQAINSGAPLINNGNPFSNSIIVQPFNLAQQLVRGIDFESSYTLPLANIVDSWNGQLGFRALATRYIKNYTNNGLTAPTNTAGENSGGGPPRWRWSASVNYRTDVIDVGLTARGVSDGAYNNSWIACTSGCPTSTVANQTININSIPGATYFDLATTYKFDLGEDKSTKMEAFLNIRNLLNSDPRIVTGTGNFAADITVSNPLNYDQDGRVFLAGIRFKM